MARMGQQSIHAALNYQHATSDAGPCDRGAVDVQWPEDGAHSVVLDRLRTALRRGYDADPGVCVWSG